MTVEWVVGIALASFWFGFALASIFAVSGRESERVEEVKADKRMQKFIKYATTAVAIALSITLSLLAHRSIEEYALVGTGETFKAAYVCLLGAAFFLGVAASGIVICIMGRHNQI